jgi:XTP/dITP diphosphohydrolase
MGVSQAGRLAENGGDVSGHAASRITGQLVIATHNPASSPRCANCLRLTASTRYRRASLASTNRTRPATRFAPMPASRRSPRPRRPACRPSPTIPGLRSMRSTARPVFFGALGRPEKGFPPRCADRTAAAGARRDHAGTAHAHFVSALCVAWPDGHTEEVEARVDGTLVWPPRGTPASATIRCSCPMDTPAPSAK